MGYIFTPEHWTGTPADRILIPYRQGSDAESVKDALYKKVKYLVETRRIPKDEYVMIVEPYPPNYVDELMPNLLNLFHTNGIHVIIRTNNPHASDFKFLDKNDIYAVTLSDGARSDVRHLRNYDNFAVGPTTMAERMCRAFAAADKSHCRVMIFYGEGCSYNYIYNSFTYIKADMFVIEGFDFTEVEKQAIREAAGERWCKFKEDGPEISAKDLKRAMRGRMRHARN